MTERYRGADRRGTIRADAAPAWWFAVAVTAVLGAAAASLDGRSPFTDVDLNSVAAGAALAVAVVCALCWRALGDTATLWVAGGLVPAAASLVAPETVAAAGHLAGAASLALIAVTHEVDTRLRRWWLLAVPSVLAAALVPLPIPAGAATVAWAVAGVALTVRALLGRRALLWFALTAGALAVAVGLDSGLPALLGAGAALTGILRSLRAVLNVQRHRLLEAAVDRLHSQARFEGAAYARERSAHDAQNALTALSGATLTLDRHVDRLDEATREQLSAGVQYELERLHGLLASDDAERVRAFPLVSALRLLRTGPHAVETVDVPEDLTVYGRVGDTGQVIQLLCNRASEVVVYARTEGAVVRIEVRGAEVERLYLEVARTLMAAQGGTLASLAGGRGYTLSMPAGPG